MPYPVYHRAYRSLALPAQSVGWSVLGAAVPDVVLLLTAPFLLRFHGEWVTALLLWIGIPVTTRVSTFGPWTMVVPDVSSYLPMRSLYPAIVAIVGCVVAFALLLPLSRLTPLRVISGMGALVCGISGGFFYFAGEQFPYDTGEFAAVWTRAEFVVWLLVPALFALILGPLPLRPTVALFFSTMTLLYAIWFSALRLTLLLTWFHLAGLIWMAPAYFLTGFLVDFVYIVSFYSLAVSRATRELRARQEVWRW
jgi:hypothetical protein